MSSIVRPWGNKTDTLVKEVWACLLLDFEDIRPPEASCLAMLLVNEMNLNQIPAAIMSELLPFASRHKAIAEG